MKNDKAVLQGLNGVRWLIILIYLAITLLCAVWKTPFANQVAPVITVVAIFSAVWLHGTARYGTRNILIFFLITWLVSNFFEALSIRTGFPFGHYYYDKLIGPRLFDVPLIIMFAYFGTGYVSWILAHVLSGQYSKPLSGRNLFFVPFIAAFIMVMWDLCIDPLCSTLGALWVWRDKGEYFGVPLQNYFGWFLVVYIIYQLFALYCSKFDVISEGKRKLFSTRLFWLEAVAVYGIQGLTQIVQFAGAKEHLDVYGSMALVAVFTMLFVTLISFLRIQDDDRLV
ncbi:carotenoid biosynthesis protein [Legionella shakespearei]|uniref:Carotene biosynthesis associated membrane protein n=1 Tax=Legionella shakespearei DSM 23087 TaxID=1122169 RepID=A0A0W0YLG5_9GAMM|nr:carotenoid biosynthesis protein [Legionella shakespearei]KTD57535.1 hypothetical protein Lsha_2376 [Legionella shakespearei DSM 23087]